MLVGIIVASLLAPSAAVAVTTALTYNGIQGTSGSQADVTKNQQLLTTEAKPTSYFDYHVTEDASGGHSSCANVIPVLPLGYAIIVKQISVVANETDGPTVNSYDDEV